jgi:prolipoprotein diacylglyceryltransferase
VETTRFHPTFAYEMIWNFFAVGILMILARKYEDKMKPGVVFSAWLILAGLGRNIIEFFRPDQPTFPGTGFSYSRFVAILMIIAGVLIILIKYKVLKIKFLPAGEEEYHIAPPLEERINQKKGKGTNKNTQEEDKKSGQVKDTEN